MPDTGGPPLTVTLIPRGEEDRLPSALALEVRACLGKWAAHKEVLSFLPVRVAWEFFDRAFLRLGILDGTARLTFAVRPAADALLKYPKLRELNRAITRRERLPPENARAEDTGVLRIQTLTRAR